MYDTKNPKSLKLCNSLWNLRDCNSLLSISFTENSGAIFPLFASFEKVKYLYKINDEIRTLITKAMDFILFFVEDSIVDKIMEIFTFYLNKKKTPFF